MDKIQFRITYEASDIRSKWIKHEMVIEGFEETSKKLSVLEGLECVGGVRKITVTALL